MQVFKQHTEWVLGSSSPRRKDLLAKQGFAFSAISPQIDETPLPNEQPQAYTRRIAALKMERAYEMIDVSRVLIITADTTVILGNEIISKPETASVTFENLKKLNGKTHRVLTSVCVNIKTENPSDLEFSTITHVEFYHFSDEVLNKYAQTLDPLDKAGGYSLQEIGTFLVKGIEGSFNNVIGLPVEILIQKLLQAKWLSLQ